ncbi:MAG: AAA family ATPase [bacterium]
MQVKILCGVSGSGKSTYIQNHFPSATVCSADHFFMKNGEYQFDPSKLPMAHGACLRKFVGIVKQGSGIQPVEGTVVVDNTNTTVSEVAPYAALALAYGHDLEIIIIEAEPGMAHSRNAHGVPLPGVMGQHNRLVKLADQLPPWWKTTKVNAEY